MSGEKIVIIDDDPEICDAMSEILSEYDYQVFTALDTKTGYQLLLEQREPIRLDLINCLDTLVFSIELISRT